MIQAYLFSRTTPLLHSPDLEDMRRAILDEDDDGPDGGCPDIRSLALVCGASPGTHPE